MKYVLVILIAFTCLVGTIVYEGYNDNYTDSKSPDASKYLVCGEKNDVLSVNDISGQLMADNNYKSIQNEIIPDQKGFYSEILRQYEIMDDSFLYSPPICEGENHFDDNWYEYYMRMIPHKALANTDSNLKNIYEQEKIIKKVSCHPSHSCKNKY